MSIKSIISHGWVCPFDIRKQWMIQIVSVCGKNKLYWINGKEGGRGIWCGGKLKWNILGRFIIIIMVLYVNFFEQFTPFIVCWLSFVPLTLIPPNTKNK